MLSARLGRGEAARGAAARTGLGRAGPDRERCRRRTRFLSPRLSQGKGRLGAVPRQRRGSLRGSAGAKPEEKGAVRCACGCPSALPGCARGRQ